MKLLDKKAISSDFNIQRKMQVDEGVNIAKKVDVLRETLTSLEAQHKKFIEGIRQDLINQTKVLEDNKSAVLGEVRQLEERRKELLKPLDDQWAELAEAQTKFKGDKEKLVIKEEQLNERESTIKKTEKTIKILEKEAIELKILSEHEREKATELRKSAEILKKNTEQDRESQNRDFLKRSAELAKREEDLVHQTKYLEVVKRTLQTKEKVLEDKNRALNDKYETLQRTIKRFNK